MIGSQKNGQCSNDNEVVHDINKVWNRIDKKSNFSKAKQDLPAATTVALPKNIDFISCLGISIGSVIGAGIFISPKGVLIGTGSIGVSLMVWSFCGLKMLFEALAYAELGTLLPNSGGTYYYLLEAFHPNRKVERSFWGSLVPFLFFWYTIFISGPVSLVVQAMATSHYIIKLASLNACGSMKTAENSEIITKLLSVAYIMIITAASCHTNKLSTRTIKCFTTAKLGAISFIIISGLTMLSLGTNEALKTGFEGTSFDGFLTAFFSGTYAYAGWDRLNNVGRELANPKRDLPRCLVLTCVTVTSFYILANISYFAVLSKEAFLASDAVAADFVDQIIGKPGVVYIIISVILSSIGLSYGKAFTNSRIVYAAAREGHVTEFLSYIHYKRISPSAAIIFMSLLAILCTPCSSIFRLISLLAFAKSIFLFMAMVALFMLRGRKINQDHFQVPSAIIYVNMAVYLGIVIVSLLKDPTLEFIAAIGTMFIGALVYTIFIYYRVSISKFERITAIVQKILLVVPPEDNDI